MTTTGSDREMPSRLKAGDAAPDFSLATGAASSCSLHSLGGSKAVLYFYPKDDTSGCTQEAIEFNRLRADFAAADTSVIGVSPDPIKSHDKFKAKHGLELTLASDEGTSMLEAYGVWGEKSMYGRRYMGVLRTTVLIDADGKVARIWENVKVPGHAAEVLEAAKAL